MQTEIIDLQLIFKKKSFLALAIRAASLISCAILTIKNSRNLSKLHFRSFVKIVDYYLELCKLWKFVYRDKIPLFNHEFKNEFSRPLES